MSMLTVSERRLRNEMWGQGQLWCSVCKRFKPAKDFWKCRNPGEGRVSNYGYRGYCIECGNTTKRNKARASAYFKNRNAMLKAKFVELAGKGCQRCGYSEFTSGLDFHHVYRAEKKFNPTRVIYNNNFGEAWKELDKCCLLCSCCHTAYEAGEWRAEFVKRDSLGWTVGAALPLDDTRYEVGKAPVYQQASLPDAYRIEKPVQMTLLEPRLPYTA